MVRYIIFFSRKDDEAIVLGFSSEKRFCRRLHPTILRTGHKANHFPMVTRLPRVANLRTQHREIPPVRRFYEA